ncbi:hypothetical protein BV881_24470 [Streptomyces sp. ZL-24]|nr:hypothetical protein BV881_24470 [Streptomyces sp. ZL-24]
MPAGACGGPHRAPAPAPASFAAAGFGGAIPPLLRPSAGGLPPCSQRRADFASRDGKLMTLFVCSKILGPHAHPQDPRLESALRVADRIVRELRAD